MSDAAQARLLVVVEGQTEEGFVNALLLSHLAECGYASVSAKKVGGGGIVPWPQFRRHEVVRRMKEDKRVLVTTMVDYYGLEPKTGNKAWPGWREAAAGTDRIDPRVIEEGMRRDVAQDLGGDYHASRFEPFVVMHEFEALLFSDCDGLARGIEQPELASRFQLVRDAFATPEDIDDSPGSSPARRIEDVVPDYEKPLFGALAALEIGLEAMRAECPHFDKWIRRLEELPGKTARLRSVRSKVTR